VPDKPRGQPLISGYTKRLARLAADPGIPVVPVPLSITRAAGFDVSGPDRVRGRAHDAAVGPAGAEGDEIA